MVTPVRGKEGPMRRGAKAAKAKVEAKLPVPRKSLKNEGSSVHQLQKRLEEALKREAEAFEQQTATSEILQVISGTPTNVQPVFDAIAQSAIRLCDAQFSAVFQFDGKQLHFVAHHGWSPEGVEALRRAFPIVPHRGSAGGRAVLSGVVAHIPDVHADQDYALGAVGDILRSTVAVPMVREGRAVGTINVARFEAGPFSDRQIALLQTFADQAVIAIENVRLFKELEERNREVTEALEQKTATSEILRVIASSPTDIQPVFDTIAERAMRLCDAAFANVHMFDGALIHINAAANLNPEGVDAVRRAFPVAPSRATASGRAILTGEVVEIPDVLADPEYQLTELAHAAGYRSSLGVPMLHSERAIGVIIVGRPEPGAFPQEQIQLLKTFADQAVIDIENVRLFTEQQEKNRALTAAHAQVTEALEQQTATAEILRVISSSPTDVEPVFQTMLSSTNRLCEASFSVLWLWDGEALIPAAHANVSPNLAEHLRTSR